MLLLPLVVALSAVDPTPSPAAAPAAAAGAPTPLQEIGRVRGRTTCTSIVVHANAAIDGALDNDRTLALMINRLSTANIDGLNEIKRRHEIDDLMKIAAHLRQQAVDGEGEVRKLRAYAAESTDPERKKELKAFADALGGALYRQRRVGVDLQRMVVILDGRREAEYASRETQVGMLQSTPNSVHDSIYANGGMHSARYADALDGPATMVNATLRAAAAELTNRLPLIAGDEGIAADHSLGATTGC